MNGRLRFEASVHEAPAIHGDPAPYAGKDSFVFVRLRITDPDGATGDGFTGRFLAAQVADFLNTTVPEMWPEHGDPLDTIRKKANPRGMTGVVVSALSALDIALTDVAAKHQGISVAQMLGGKRPSAPVHITCGFPALEIGDLAKTCAAEVEAGARGVKVLVAAKGRGVLEDAERLRAVREAIGPQADLIADANCGMDLATAQDLARAVCDLNLTWLEEPVHGNDRRALAALAADSLVRIGAGQMEQHPDRFALLDEAGVDVLQPNAVFAGGFSATIDAASAGLANGRYISPGGGWDLINLHWMCGALSRGAVELHRAQSRIVRLLMPEGPQLANGHLYVPTNPGLGLDPDEAALAACRIK